MKRAFICTNIDGDNARLIGGDVPHVWVPSRRILVLVGLALWSIVVGIVVRATLLSWGLAASTAAAVGGIVALWLIALSLVLDRRVWGPFSGIADRQWGIAALSAIAPTGVPPLSWTPDG